MATNRKLLEVVAILADYPLEEFSLEGKADDYSLFGANDWRLLVGHVRRARDALEEEKKPTMQDAVEAGDSVLLNEQASLLRECRTALDSLICQKPLLAGWMHGSTTLGNLRASLYDYRPQGVFGGSL